MGNVLILISSHLGGIRQYYCVNYEKGVVVQ